MNELANHPGGMAVDKQQKKAAAVDAETSTKDTQKKYRRAQQELHKMWG